EQVGEVDAGLGRERVVAPGPRVEVEQLELAVAGVELELELDEPLEGDAAEDLVREALDLRRVDGLDVGARAAELGRVLAQAAGDHRRPRRPPRRTHTR